VALIRLEKLKVEPRERSRKAKKKKKLRNNGKDPKEGGSGSSTEDFLVSNFNVTLNIGAGTESRAHCWRMPKHSPIASHTSRETSDAPQTSPHGCSGELRFTGSGMLPDEDDS
jgi:hypothetical protein